jgi:hypothetical protein
VSVPGIFGGLLIQHVLFRVHVNVWLPALAVEIFTEQIEHCSDTLMRVMLIETLELRCELPENSLEGAWVGTVAILHPHLVHKPSISQSQLTTSAEHILIRYVFAVHVLLIQEELRELV